MSHDSSQPAIAQRLADLGYPLPPAPPALASYIPAKLVDDVLYVSGQLPLVEGELIAKGPVGEGGVTLELAQKAATRCAINGLAAAQAALSSIGKGLDDVRSIGRVEVYVASHQGFTDQHKVANGASDFMGEVWGHQGQHARLAVGVASLPLGASVELAMILHC